MAILLYIMELTTESQFSDKKSKLQYTLSTAIGKLLLNPSK